MPFPSSYEVVIRPDDGEHVGYLAPVGDAWQPINLLGFPLADATNRDEATETAVRLGLASLNGNWWCRAPLPMAHTEAELRHPQPDWEWRKVVVVELNETTASLRPAIAWPEEQGRTTTISLPATELLRQFEP